MRAAVLFSLALVLGGLPVCAQENTDSAPLPTLRIGTTLVSVAAFVRDKQGRPVAGLTADDLQLQQDGKPQPIRFFSQGSDQPLTLELLLDTSGSQAKLIPDETAASMVFFRSMLEKREDRAALVQFDTQIYERQPLTPDVDNLQRGLDYVRPSANQGGTLLYDAIVATAGKMQALKGRKAMVLLTDGDDHGSRASLKDALAAAQKADVVVYSIYYSELSTTLRPGALAVVSPARGALEKLAGETGGQVFDAGPRYPLRQTYAMIAEQLRLEYLLGYRPPDASPGTYHRIDLRGKTGELRVNARKGFYTPGA